MLWIPIQSTENEPFKILHHMKNILLDASMDSFPQTVDGAMLFEFVLCGALGPRVEGGGPQIAT